MLKKLNKSYTQSFVWNIISSGLASIVPSLCVLIVTRILGIDKSGELSYAIAIADWLRRIAMFGTSYIQATDVTQEYSFSLYFRQRFISVSIAILGLSVFVATTSFTIEKKLIILLWCVYIIVDAASGVFEGSLQQCGKLYLGARLKSARLFFSTFLFAAVTLISKNIFYGLGLLLTSAIIITIIGVWLTRHDIGRIREPVPKGYMVKLALQCLPVFFGELCAVALVSAPRLMISSIYSDAVLGIYAILQMPTRLSNLFSRFLYTGPELTKCAGYYKSGNLKALRKRIMLQLFIIMGFGLSITFVMLLVGVQLFSWAFDVDLSSYKLPFLLLVFNSAIVAAAAFLGNMMIVIRRQKIYLAGYMVTAILGTALQYILIVDMEIIGAAIGSMAVYLFLSAYFAASFFIAMRKNRTQI